MIIKLNKNAEAKNINLHLLEKKKQQQQQQQKQTAMFALVLTSLWQIKIHIMLIPEIAAVQIYLI